MRADTMMPLLNVADVAASLAWYAHLGLQELQRRERDGVPQWALLGLGPHRLMLSRSDRPAPGKRRGGMVLYLGVADAHAAHRALSAAGLSPGPVERQRYGVDEFGLRDPDGYELAVTGEPVQLA